MLESLYFPERAILCEQSNDLSAALIEHILSNKPLSSLLAYYFGDVFCELTQAIDMAYEICTSGWRNRRGCLS